MVLTDVEVDDILEALESHYADQLNEWEGGFVENITEQWGQKRWLTAAQRAKLAEVWEGFASGRRG